MIYVAYNTMLFCSHFSNLLNFEIFVLTVKVEPKKLHSQHF